MAVLCAACSPKEQARQDTWPVVKTEGGLVSGTLVDSVHIFKGIPFAAPPVDELRWREPQPVKPWADTLACVAFGASPIQNDPKPFMMWTQEFITPAKPLSEDCLFLNVWTAAKSPEEKRPVLVWIHGGAFLSGSGACPVYDGEALAKAGIVYVSINYRLGVFGFMAHPELTAESEHESSGNYGLMDQVAALQWIKNNIAAFGGDPSKVTIAGQSAGSMAVQALVASPLAKGLFRGAIAESGAMTGRPSTPLSEAEKTGTALSKKINSESIEALRQLPADSLLSLANTLPFGSFFPVVDGYVLTGDVRSTFQNKQHNDVAVVAGWVSGDAELVLGNIQSPAQFKASAQTRYGDRAGEFLKLFPADDDTGSKAAQRKLALLQFAGYPDREWALYKQHNTYLYEFTYVPTDKPGFPNYGAFHTSEVPFALHTLKHWDRPWVEADRQVEAYMSSYWINFVKTGDPNGKGLPEWKKYEAAGGNIQELGAVSVAQPGKYAAEFEFLKSVNP
jgi:para-nitrobenzyl esterase